jgi:hypothetical protein
MAGGPPEHAAACCDAARETGMSSILKTRDLSISINLTTQKMIIFKI